MPLVTIACEICHAEFVAPQHRRRKYCSRKCFFTTRIKHGNCKVVTGIITAEYRAWQNMHQRCKNTKFRQYKDYGGRGITVCERWNSFDNFLEDMGPRPSAQHSLDRLGNNLGYEKDNCKWATEWQQKHNRRANVWLSAFGVSMVQKDWARVIGVGEATVIAWLRKFPELSFEEMIAR